MSHGWSLKALDTLRQLQVDQDGWAGGDEEMRKGNQTRVREKALGLTQKGLRNGGNMASRNNRLNVVHWLESGDCIEEENMGRWEVYNPGKI